MRRRVLLALALFATVAALSFAVPLALSTADARTQRLMLDRGADIERFALLTESAVAQKDTTSLRQELDRYTDVYGEGVMVLDAQGQVMYEAHMDRGATEVQKAVDAAQRNQRTPRTPGLTPMSADTVLLARPVGTGVQVDGVVVLQASTTGAKADITRAWVYIAQRQLVADTAHKLRNPLAALQIRLDSLAPSIPDEAQSTFGRAGLEVERLGSLLDGMLRLAVAESPTRFERATGARSDLADHADTCDAALVVHDRVDAWAAAFAAAGMALEADAESAEVAMSADSLTQVLDATLSNSCAYAGSGSRTTVTVRRADDSTEIVVSDNGKGVRPEDIVRLTERFYRGDRGQDGSGLGLSIVKAVTGSHRAELTITAMEPHGLRVAITMAAVDSDAE